MGVLKLSVIEEQNKKLMPKIKVIKGGKYHVGNCSCPCECFIREGEVVMEDVQSTASWNID